MSYQNHKIVKKYLILCEGTDDQNFLIEYLNSSTLAYDQRFCNDIQVMPMNGINNLADYIYTITNSEGFEKVNRMMIVRDADQNVTESCLAIQNALNKNHLPVPDRCNEWTEERNGISVTFTLMPLCSKDHVPGALEDLCWSILLDDETNEMKDDVKSFVRQMKDKYHKIGIHENKSRIHTYFSVNDRFISMKIGEAAKAGTFNWKSDKLNDLKDLMMEGFDS